MAAHDIYLGEPEPRKISYAVLLSLLMPGLGHLYVGRPRSAIAGFLIFEILFLGIVALTVWRDIFLVRATLGITLLYLFIETWLIGDLIQSIRKQARTYILRPYNHALVYSLVFLVLFAGPMWFSANLIQSKIYGSVTVADESMYPRLWEGDHVFFRRTTMEQTGFQRGDTALVRLNDGSLSILRIAGIPGDKVRIDPGGRVHLNNSQLNRNPLGRVQWKDESQHGKEELRLVAYLENTSSHDYEVFFDPSVSIYTSQEFSLPKGAFFLLADNRTTDYAMDSRHLGPIGESQLVGRPLYVWYSTPPQSDQINWSRVGIPID